MDQFIESLESRALMSVSPAVAALKAEGKVATAELIALEKGGKASFNLIVAELKAGKELKAGAKLVTTLRVEGTAATTALARGLAGANSRITVDVNRLTAAFRVLQKHAGSTQLQAKVTAAANTLNTDATNKLTIIQNEVAARENIDKTDVDAIVAANPSDNMLASDVTTAGNNAAAARTAFLDAVSTALTTDVAAAVANFPR